MNSLLNSRLAIRLPRGKRAKTLTCIIVVGPVAMTFAYRR
jgi:hypothetical protein